MVPIKPECVPNALGMLLSRPEYFIGWLQDDRCFLVDGKVWIEYLDRSIARCDDPDENRQMLKKIKKLNPLYDFDRLAVGDRFRFYPGGQVYRKVGDWGYTDDRDQQYVERPEQKLIIEPQQ